MKNFKLNPNSTVEEIRAYLEEYVRQLTSVYHTKAAIACFSYKIGGETRVQAVCGAPSDFFTVDTCSVDEKSFSSRHVSNTVEKTYKLRFTNVKNKGADGKSFFQKFFNKNVVFDMSIDEFMESYDEFVNSMDYSDVCSDIAKARYEQRKKHLKENTQLTLTVGHFVEKLICDTFGIDWKLNVSNFKNGYDVKDNNGQTYEVKSCLGKIKYNGETYSFGGSSIELTKDR